MKPTESPKTPAASTSSKKKPLEADADATGSQTEGEALQTCSDSEWDSSDEPYAAELLNVKKKPNRVNVFSGCEKTFETIRVVSSPPPVPVIRKDNCDLHGLARLIQKTCEVFIENSTTSDETELHIKLEFPDVRNETPKQFL